jgi:DNA-binding response OmpR family regulator
MRPHVLVLERSRELREALVDGLHWEGFVVTPAPTEEAALVSLRTFTAEQLPDVVVLDVADEPAVVDELRSDERYAAVALVALSFGFDAVPEADVAVRRPFRLDDVARAVRLVLARRGRWAAGDDGSRPWA